MGRKPPSAAATASTTSKKAPLTLAQIAAYDDILTDALIDHAFYWTVVPKNRPSYHASRGTREEEITKIITHDIIVAQDLARAEAALLATPGLHKFYTSLKTDAERTNFRAHLQRYMQLYLPDCSWEVTSTNRYTIVNHEAAIAARRFIRKNETIKYLAGIQVVMTAKEEEEISKRKKDFSVVVSARSKCASLFMGPARFANHDCNANAKLMTTGNLGIEIVATRNIEIGEEITVTYAQSYFGENNCECLCQTCEKNLQNGWAQPLVPGVLPVKPSIESDTSEGYSLRRRRPCDDSRSVSRASSVTEDIRPKVSRRRIKHADIANTPATTSPADDSGRGSVGPTAQVVTGAKRQLESPPGSPTGKRAKMSKEKKTECVESMHLTLPAVNATHLLPPTPESSGSEDGLLQQTHETTSESASEVVNKPQPTPAATEKSAVAPTKVKAPAGRPHRTPGDYTLTPLLLFESNMAWISCTICSNAFVQPDAYFTRSSCPRCERHSKLYGYMWPKTDKEGPRDKEERILDHRTVHRFLATADEMRARGRKVANMKDNNDA